jgi:hypothetical protein
LAPFGKGIGEGAVGPSSIWLIKKSELIKNVRRYLMKFLLSLIFLSACTPVVWEDFITGEEQVAEKILSDVSPQAPSKPGVFIKKPSSVAR